MLDPIKAAGLAKLLISITVTLQHYGAIATSEVARTTNAAHRDEASSFSSACRGAFGRSLLVSR